MESSDNLPETLQDLKQLQNELWAIVSPLRKKLKPLVKQIQPPFEKLKAVRSKVKEMERIGTISAETLAGIDDDGQSLAPVKDEMLAGIDEVFAGADDDGKYAILSKNRTKGEVWEAACKILTIGFAKYVHDVAEVHDTIDKKLRQKFIDSKEVQTALDEVWEETREIEKAIDDTETELRKILPAHEVERWAELFASFV